MQISEAFDKTCSYAIKLGHKSINQLPGCLELQVDSVWWFALNAHKEPAACSKGTVVPPFTAYFECNGFPCGMVDPHGGAMIGIGSGDYEGALIEALDAAMAGAHA